VKGSAEREKNNVVGLKIGKIKGKAERGEVLSGAQLQKKKIGSGTRRWGEFRKGGGLLMLTERNSKRKKKVEQGEPQGAVSLESERRFCEKKRRAVPNRCLGKARRGRSLPFTARALVIAKATAQRTPSLTRLEKIRGRPADALFLPGMKKIVHRGKDTTLQHERERFSSQKLHLLSGFRKAQLKKRGTLSALLSLGRKGGIRKESVPTRASWLT